MEQPGEILLHINAIGISGCGEAVKNGAGSGAFDGIAEQPLFSADGKGANGVFGSVVGDGDEGILQEGQEILFLGKSIGDSLGKGSAGGGFAGICPCEKGVRNWF